MMVPPWLRLRCGVYIFRIDPECGGDCSDRFRQLVSLLKSRRCAWRRSACTPSSTGYPNRASLARAPDGLPHPSRGSMRTRVAVLSPLRGACPSTPLSHLRSRRIFAVKGQKSKTGSSGMRDCTQLSSLWVRQRDISITLSLNGEESRKKVFSRSGPRLI